MTRNHSFNRTRYGKRREPGLRHLVHHLSPRKNKRKNKRDILDILLFAFVSTEQETKA